VLEHAGDGLGLLLWRSVSDVLLWCDAPQPERSTLFQTTPDPAHALAECSDWGAVTGSLRALAVLYADPGRADPETLSSACAQISGWAEGEGLTEVALQFAEAAARLAPNSSLRSYVAGRLCRRRGDFPRAMTWLRRAIRLARRARMEGIDAKNEIDFANAHRGYGFVFTDMGEMARAEPHFWKCIRAALRVGHKSLAGSGFHDLLLVAVHMERWDDALEYAKKAVEYYKRGHPRFPLLAHDVAFFWTRRGYYSSALPVVERILPWVEHQRERILVLATLVRCAAAVRDHLRYQRVAREVRELAASDTEMSASSLYHLAEGARCFHDWETAEQLGRRALDLAIARKNGTIVRWAETLLAEVASRIPGEYDAIPEEGSVVDETRELILYKLRHQPPPDPNARPVPPDKYPTD
jgi:tetratricopeptide (TPR) repeat protein